MKLRYFKFIIAAAGIVTISSCKKQFDINYDPDRLPDSNSPIEQLLTSAQVNLGFEGGSDLFRYSTLIMQQMSGGASQPNQTYEYYRHNITGSDQNNLWSSIYATTLSDLELIIKQGGASPYYTGIAKILKAYEYSLVVDTWGDVPFTEAQKLTANTQPAYDDDATIYPKLIQLLTDAVTDLNAASSVLTPGTNSVIYTSTSWTTARANWIKLANTLKLRLLLHYSKVNPSFCVAQITALVNTAGIQFMASNADNFQMNFYNVANQRSPISAFEVSRPNYLFADARMLSLMNGKSDPRRPFYFSDFPVGSGNYVGVSATALPPAPNNNYSRIHTFLRGAVTTPAVGTNSAVYSGAAPQRKSAGKHRLRRGNDRRQRPPGRRPDRRALPRQPHPLAQARRHHRHQRQDHHRPLRPQALQRRGQALRPHRHRPDRRRPLAPRRRHDHPPRV